HLRHRVRITDTDRHRLAQALPLGAQLHLDPTEVRTNLAVPADGLPHFLDATVVQQVAEDGFRATAAVTLGIDALVLGQRVPQQRGLALLRHPVDDDYDDRVVR